MSPMESSGRAEYSRHRTKLRGRIGVTGDTMDSTEDSYELRSFILKDDAAGISSRHAIVNNKMSLQSLFSLKSLKH